MEKDELVDDKLMKELMEQHPLVLEQRNELVVKYLVDGKQIECIAITLKDNAPLKVNYYKGHIVVSTEDSVVFMCKAKDFISLWN